MFNEMEQKQNANPIQLVIIVVSVLIVVGLSVWGALRYYGQYRQGQAIEIVPNNGGVNLSEKQAILDALNKGSTTTPLVTISEKEAILKALNKNTTPTKSVTQTSQATIADKQAILDALNKN